MDLDEVVCPCLNVTAGDIKTAVENGATTLEAVQETTQAGTACGACIDRIEELIGEFK